MCRGKLNGAPFFYNFPLVGISIIKKKKVEIILVISNLIFDYPKFKNRFGDMVIFKHIAGFKIRTLKHLNKVFFLFCFKISVISIHGLNKDSLFLLC